MGQYKDPPREWRDPDEGEGFPVFEELMKPPRMVGFIGPIYIVSSAAKHLQWIHNRLVNVHGEDANFDYMIRLREIIEGSYHG